MDTNRQMLNASIELAEHCDSLNELGWYIAKGRKLPTDKATSHHLLQLIKDAVEKLWELDECDSMIKEKSVITPAQEAKEFLEKQPPTPEKAFKDCPVIRVLGDKDIHEAWLISSSMAWVKHSRLGNKT